MTLRTIVLTSDVHELDDINLPKHKHVRDLANSLNADLVIHAGDIFNEQELMPVFHTKQMAIHRLTGWIATEDRYLMQLYTQIHQSGGVENIQELIRVGQIKDDRAYHLEKAISRFQRHADEINALAKKYETTIKFNDKVLEFELGQLKEKLDEEAKLRNQRLDRLIRDINCPVFAVRGNWEYDNCYGMKEIKWLDRTSVVDFHGIKIAGAQNWYEQHAESHDMFYQEREKDPTVEQLVPQMTQEELHQVQNRQIPLRLLEDNPTYQRLKGEEIDILVGHKGTTIMERDEENKYQSGIGFDAIFTESKAKIVLAGHRHDDGFFEEVVVGEDHAYQGVRSSDSVVQVLTVDDESKRIVKLTSYKWANKDHKNAA